MQESARELSKDVLLVCFSRILPWNDLDVLQAAMSFNSESLYTDETVPEYDKNAVRAQLRGIKTLTKLTMVSRLFSEAAQCTLRDFKKTFLTWIDTQDCTIEGVHGGMIVFQTCSETVELLCEKMQYAGVSDHWSPFGWYDDWETQVDHMLSDTTAIIFDNNPTRTYKVLTGHILLELMKRLLLALSFHPRSHNIFARCAFLAKMFKDSFDGEDDSAMVQMLEVELRVAMKPNFKRLYPNLWNLNMSGIDVDRARWRNTPWQRTAYKGLDKYVQALCDTWNLLTLIQNGEITLQMNQEQLQENFLQINWFSVSDYAMLLLRLRQMVVVNLL
tara:strand:+ start:10425 stop:11417 length:993 start_codon:yes stop_codon:yes gene_type:complete